MATLEAENAQLRQRQLEQAEEIFFSGPQKSGFAKDLFFGKFRAHSILPYPEQSHDERVIGDKVHAAVRDFVTHHIDAARIDREARIPDDVVQGLGRVGVLGATIAPKYGGRGLSQFNYCRLMETIGGHCGSTAVFVNAHHSIGLRMIELFGTTEQRERWLPSLCTGERLAAFALTEPEAGSDAANVQTRAVPTPDGRGYILNGQKRYITNGGIAQVLTVMARTPDPGDPQGKVTAFLVTPDMPGFEVIEARMEKVGIRGTATARLAFRDMFVPRENILGQIGKGLRLALTVLDFGRTTFGATCTGAAKFCLERSIEYANARRQFGKPIGKFELIQEKIANMAADTFAMESATYYTAALIDSGAHDYMLETSMLKVFASDSLWRIVNDALQIHGGAGFFTDQPFERMMRDARLNLIGEGANEVLRCFNGVVGLRDLGKQLQNIRRRPWKLGKLLRTNPTIPVSSGVLQPAASSLASQIAKFSRACQRALFTYRESIVDREFILSRLGDTAMELFHSGCVYARLSSILSRTDLDDANRQRLYNTGLLYLKLAQRRNRQRLIELRDNEDAAIVKTAKYWLDGQGAG